MKLQVQGLNFRYGTQPVLQDISLQAEAPQCVAILGVNGAGKSTLLKCIGRILPHCTGNIALDGTEVNRLPPRQRARLIAFLPQHPTLPDITVFDAVLLGRRPYVHWEPDSQDLELVQQVLTQLNLQHLAMRNAATLSGGEQQLVALARALAQHPALLLCDEPTSNLDPKNQLDVIRLLNHAAREHHMMVMATMHDLNLALRFATRFLFLKNHRIVAAGDETIVTPSLIRDIYDIDATITQQDHLKTVLIPPEQTP